MKAVCSLLWKLAWNGDDDGDESNRQVEREAVVPLSIYTWLFVSMVVKSRSTLLRPQCLLCQIRCEASLDQSMPSCLPRWSDSERPDGVGIASQEPGPKHVQICGPRRKRAVDNGEVQQSSHDQGWAKQAN